LKKRGQSIFTASFFQSTVQCYLRKIRISYGVRYADGNEVFMKDSEPLAKIQGAIGFKGGGEIEVFNPEKVDDFVSYKLVEDGRSCNLNL